MLNIKKIVVSHLYKIALSMIVVLFGAAIIFQVFEVQRQVHENSATRFSQIEQVLTENQKEIDGLMEIYYQTSLDSAEAIAYIIQGNPSVIEDIDELKKIARFMEVDEIHIFDKTGRIFAGTNPEYYNYTFDSGEQIAFFKPMLKDKSLRLYQEITPNTAEGKLMQYSALWSENGEFIVQVGMESVTIKEIMENNNLSNVFSMLRANPGVSMCAVDLENVVVTDSTDLDDVGKSLYEIGFKPGSIRERGAEGFYASVNGVPSYCIFKVVDGNLIGYMVSCEMLFRTIPKSIAGFVGCLILIVVILVSIMIRCMNKYVINGIYDINGGLRKITEGNLEERVDVQSSLEFSELSSHINEMIKSLLSSIEKMSYVLNKTNMHIGVYEYSEKMKGVRFTEHIPEILGLDVDKAKEISSNYKLFKEYINKLRENPVPGEEGIFCPEGNKEFYIRFEEMKQNNDTFGIVMDVTEEVIRRRLIEEERDKDLLTGLYNRRGLDNRLDALFEAPEKLGFGALIMIDADGLKEINDKYGHEKGDVYIKKISEVICSFSSKSCIAARQGGDEFVLFLYNYDSEEELLGAIENLRYIQNNSTAHFDNDWSVPLRFSFGFAMTKGQSEYSHLLKLADERMYINKRERKEAYRLSALLSASVSVGADRQNN